jgi:CheY-like chemotaxis protein
VSEEFIIAVIDDDESFRIALVTLLQSLRYEAQEFVSAVEFINRGGERSCDCIITDFNMPEMSGLDLIQLLNARGSTVPVIMVTGCSEPALEAKAAAGWGCLPADEAVRGACFDRLSRRSPENLIVSGHRVPAASFSFQKNRIISIMSRPQSSRDARYPWYRE